MLTNLPTISYTVQGRLLHSSSNYHEQIFIDENPLIARQRAFDYLNYYIDLLRNDDKISMIFNKIYAPQMPERFNFLEYEIQFLDNDFGSNGIAIYMIKNNQHETNSIADKHLIYSFKNPVEIDFDPIKNALLYEYQLFKALKIDTTDHEEDTNIFHILEILKTPIDFDFVHQSLKKSKVVNNSVKNDFESPNLLKTTFISKFNSHIVKQHIASFLNTDGGKIYFRKSDKGIIKSTFFSDNTNQNTKIISHYLMRDFKSFINQIQIKYVKINGVLITYLLIESNIAKACFYNNDVDNRFFYRSAKGIEVMTDTPLIVEYVCNRREYKLSDLANYLDL